MKQASTVGPAQRKAFRDNYLAAIIAVAGLFLQLTAIGQSGPTRAQLQDINATGYNYQSGGFRKLLYVPLDTLSTADSGSIAYKSRSFFLKKGTKWITWGKPNQINDSTVIISGDTVVIRGSGGGGGGGAPSGPAGGDLTGTYPNPTIATNAVDNSKFRQSAALSVVGNPGNALDDVIDIQALNDGGVLRRFGTSINFGAINLASGNAVGSSILAKSNGGTGTASPALVQGTNVTITGTWPNQTINASGGSSLTAGIQTSVTGSKINYDPRINSDLVFNDFLLSTIGPKWDASHAGSTTITFPSGYMRLVGGSSSDYIFDSVTTIIHRWNEEIGAIIQSVGGSDYFSFGIQAQGIQTILFKIKASDLSSTITYNNGATTLGTTPAQGTTAIGNRVIYRIRRDNYTIYFDVVNVTQSTSQTFTFNYTNVDAVSSTVYPFRAFSVTLNPIAGTIDIDYVKLLNQERLYADWLIVGHSIAEGFNAGNPDSTYYNRLQNYFPDKRFGLYAISGSKAVDFVGGNAQQYDMLALRGKRALIISGVNDAQVGASTPAFIADMRKLVDTLENHGTQVMICNVTPYDAAHKSTIISYNAALLAEFGKQVINIWDTLEINGLMQSSNDSLHPDGAGHRYMFNVLKDEITRLANSPYDPEGIIRIFPRGIEAGTKIYGAQSNFGIVPANIGNSGTNFPAFAYNTKFTATSGVHNYLNSDVASRMEMGANIAFYTAPSGTTGDPITFTPQMYVTPTGIGIGVGTTSPVSKLHIKQNGNSLTTLGNARWLTLDNTGAALGDRMEIGISYLNGNTYSASGIGAKIVGNSAYTLNDLYLFNREDESGDNPPLIRLLIHPNGFTGIKVLDPLQALHVGGQVRIDTVNTGSGSDSVVVINGGVLKKVLQSSIGGGGSDGNGIYTGNGSLSTNTTVSGAGSSLTLGASGSKLASLTTNVTGTSTYNSNAHTFVDGSGNSFGMTAGFFSIAGSLNLKVERATDANTSVTTSSCVFILPDITAGRTLSLPSTAREGMVYIVVDTNTTSNVWSFGGGGSLVDQTGSAVTTFANGVTYTIIGDNSANKYRILNAATKIPKVYTALLTQSGTSAPTAIVLGTNTIGTIVWTRSSAGVYVGTLSGAFTANKTWLTVGWSDESASGNIVFRLKRTSSNTVELLTTSDGVNGSDGFTNLSLRAEVYP